MLPRQVCGGATNVGGPGTLGHNAVAEIFSGAMNPDLLGPYGWSTRDVLLMAILRFSEVFESLQRRNKKLGNPSRAQYERRWHEANAGSGHKPTTVHGTGITLERVDAMHSDAPASVSTSGSTSPAPCEVPTTLSWYSPTCQATTPISSGAP